jgi:hypothetical protein
MTLGRSAPEVWDNVVDNEVLGAGQTRKKLMAKGWRAVRVTVLLADL